MYEYTIDPPLEVGDDEEGGRYDGLVDGRVVETVYPPLLVVPDS
jgi:hypothetical protein